MEFKDGQWITSKQGIDVIVNKIVGSEMHGSEYDPLFKEDFLKRRSTQAFRTEINTNIQGVTNEWCKIANTSINAVSNDKKKQAHKLSEKIEKATIELMKRTKNFQKLNGGESKGNKRPRVTYSNDATMNVDTPNNKRQTRTVTPSNQQSSDSEIVTNFKEVFGKDAFNLLNQLNDSYTEGEHLFENVEKARIKAPRFKELNEELGKFNIEFMRRI
jgi:hypothetical protein